MQVLEFREIRLNAKDAEAIAKSWRKLRIRQRAHSHADLGGTAKNLGERPTVRAIQEHFGKLKKDAAAYGEGVSTSKPCKPPSGPIRSLPATPVKRKAPKSSSTSKSKRARKDTDQDADEATISRQEVDDITEASSTPDVSIVVTGRARRAASAHVRALVQKAYASDSNEDQNGEEESDNDDDGEFQDDGDEDAPGDADASDEQAAKPEAVQWSTDIKTEADVMDDEI